MSDKLTYRDILVYTLNGLIGLILIGLIFRDCLQYYILKNEIKNSEILILILIPVCYLIGHVVLSIDNLIFMQIINKDFRKKLSQSNFTFVKYIHCLFFGYRIVGVKDLEWESSDSEFRQICTTLKNNGKFEQADRYYILSDFFKGLIIIELFVIIISSIKSDWNYLVISVWLLFVFYLRARKYSNEYIVEIKSQSKLMKK